MMSHTWLGKIADLSRRASDRRVRCCCLQGRFGEAVQGQDQRFLDCGLVPLFVAGAVNMLVSTIPS